MVAVAVVVGLDQRLADPVRQVHPDRRDARALHRARRVRVPAAVRPRAASSASRSRTRSTTRFGPIPVAFIVLVVLTVVDGVRAAPAGLGLAAAGGRLRRGPAARGSASASTGPSSAATSPRRCSSFLGALMLMGQYGIGDPSQGSAYTLTSITAVVLGGTSLLGGRGTFVGPLLGAVLLQQAAERHGLPRPRVHVAVLLPGLAHPRRRGRLHRSAARVGGSGPWTPPCDV